MKLLVRPEVPRGFRLGFSVLQVLTGVSVLWGGLELMLDRSGSSVGLTRAALQGTPFADFWFAGLFLFAIGLAAIIAGIYGLLDHRLAPVASIGVGMALFLFAVIELLVTPHRATHQQAYLTLGALFILGGLIYTGHWLRFTRPPETA